ncbi:MAG: DUF1838 family protein [Pseudomonadales bacterium]|nr:DUF1838 family protein [Pseudomonadales bacterium]
MSKISRRTALRSTVTGALGVAGLGLLSNDTHAATATPGALPDFNDPLQAMRAQVKMVGSIGTEPVFTFYRLNIYADPGTGNFVPFFTMNNVLVDYWQALEDNQHEMRKYEVGFYTRIDSQEPLEYFDNPLTGKRVNVHHFRLGPVPRMYTVDGVIAMGYNPNPLPIEVIGDRVFLATQSIENTPDRVHPGETNYVNSFSTYSARLADITDPNVTSAPNHAQLQNKNKWAPWFEMGDRPGGTVARGFGTKIRSLDALPPVVLAGVKRFVPEILDTQNWTDFKFEDSEYLREQAEKAPAKS